MGCDSSRLRKKEEPDRPEYLEPKKVISTQPKKTLNGGQKQNTTRGKPPKYRTKIDSRVLAKYDVKALIGKGSFSDVLRVENKLTKQPYAVKILRLKNQHSKEVSQSELRALTRVRHPYVIQLMEVFESKECVYLVMELATGGELYERIKMKGHLTEKESIRILQMVLDGVIYLHSKGITHRDLKPENLLFYHPGQDSKILITDFGFAKTATSAEDKTLFTTWCGTPEYIAPELLCKKPYTNSVDLWAIGVITYVMISGHLPFAAETPSKLYQQIVRAKYSYSREVWKRTSDGAKNFIDKLLHVEPDKRLKAVEARKEAWVNSVPPLTSHKGQSSKYLSSQASGKSAKSTLSYKSPIFKQKKFNEEIVPSDVANNEKSRVSIREDDAKISSEEADRKLKIATQGENIDSNNDFDKDDGPVSSLNRYETALLSPAAKEKPESTVASIQEEFPSAAATEDSNSVASRAEACPCDNELVPHEFDAVSPRARTNNPDGSQAGCFPMNRFADDTTVVPDWIEKRRSDNFYRNPLDFNSRSQRGMSWRNPRRGELDLMFAPLQKSKLNWYMQEKASVIEKVGLWLEEQNGYTKEERLSNSHGDIDRLSKLQIQSEMPLDNPLLQYASVSAASSPIKHYNDFSKQNLPSARASKVMHPELTPQVSSELSDGLPVSDTAVFDASTGAKAQIRTKIKPDLTLKLKTGLNAQLKAELQQDAAAKLEPVNGLLENSFASLPHGIESYKMQRGQFNGNIF
ncbi:calcium/calmodulin-dependent protein kinase type IV-like [Rhopilema esculentum]|uniref:calcium/calmodulin-dependent protein kinase type IV-like n=1 Tax=Rhopilema esculentum TaxID=499914 RepID=UPI0031DE4CCA